MELKAKYGLFQKTEKAKQYVLAPLEREQASSVSCSADEPNWGLILVGVLILLTFINVVVICCW